MSSVGSSFANSVLDRLKLAYGLVTDAELAEMLDVKPNTVSGWRARGSVPYDLIVEKCDGVDLNSLFAKEAGALPALEALWVRDTVTHYVRRAHNAGDSAPIPEGYAAFVLPEQFKLLDPKLLTVVPLYNAELSAGPGVEGGNAEVVQYVAFLTDYMRRVLKIDPAYAFICYVKGQSMEPDMRDGDLVIGEQTRVLDRHGIFAFRLWNDIYVKHVQQERGIIKLKSRNQLYDEIVLDDPSEADFSVIGRIAAVLTRT